MDNRFSQISTRREIDNLLQKRPQQRLRISSGLIKNTLSQEKKTLRQRPLAHESFCVIKALYPE
jgi:hypothetical protein